MRASLRNVGVTRLERLSAQQVLAASVVLTDDARRAQLSVHQLKARQAASQGTADRPGSRLDLGVRRSPAPAHTTDGSPGHGPVSPGWGAEAAGRVSPSPSQWQDGDATAELLQAGALDDELCTDSRTRAAGQLLHLDLRENRLTSIATIRR